MEAATTRPGSSDPIVNHIGWGETIRACDGCERPHVAEGIRRAVFLDRDGTIIKNKPYNCDPGAIEILPGVIDGLRLLQDRGYLLVVVTNQAGVARGVFAESDIVQLHRRLDWLLRENGVVIRAFYYCPHHVEGIVEELAVACDCRKPAPGMIARAARELAIDLAPSWVIGDQATDAEAGRAAGCRAIVLEAAVNQSRRLGRAGLFAAARAIDAAVGRDDPGSPAALPAARLG